MPINKILKDRTKKNIKIKKQLKKMTESSQVIMYKSVTYVIRTK